MSTLAEVFGHAFKDVHFDGRLVKAVYRCQIRYLNSSREYLEFFGGNLLGVHVVRFRDQDVIQIFNDLDVDYYALTEAIKRVDDINQEYKVSSDTFNLTMMYLIHRFATAPTITDTQRERAMYDCGLLFFYRCIAALLSAYFRYPADPRIAQMAYAKLSRKYLIKQLGSWHRVMDYRALDLISKDGIHRESLVSFNNDLGIVYAINDSQGRIRDLIKNYYVEFNRVHVSGQGIGSTGSTMIDLEGDEVLKEKTRSVESYAEYIGSIIDDPYAFVKDDLVSVICKINSNTSHRMLSSVLMWMSDRHTDPAYVKIIDEFTQMTVIHSFHLLNDNVTVVNLRDYPTILVSLKYLYLSTRSSDVDLIRIRELGETIVQASQDVEIRSSLAMATRTAMILYIALRTLVGKAKS